MGVSVASPVRLNRQKAMEQEEEQKQHLRSNSWHQAKTQTAQYPRNTESAFITIIITIVVIVIATIMIFGPVMGPSETQS